MQNPEARDLHRWTDLKRNPISIDPIFENFYPDSDRDPLSLKQGWLSIVYLPFDLLKPVSVERRKRARDGIIDRNEITEK